MRSSRAAAQRVCSPPPVDEGDLLAPGVARRYRDAVLAAGGSAPAAELVQRFLRRPYGFAAYEKWLNAP